LLFFCLLRKIAYDTGLLNAAEGHAENAPAIELKVKTKLFDLNNTLLNFNKVEYIRHFTQVLPSPNVI